MTSPKFTCTRSRSSSITVLTAYTSPSMRTISSCSSCSGIAVEVALDRERIAHEARAVERADRVLVRDAGRDHLAPA